MWPEWISLGQAARLGALDYSYDAWLVGLSCTIAILAAYAAFYHLERLTLAASDRARIVWLLTSAASMGGGIWSMHFVGMLAVRFPGGMDHGYDPWITGLSLLFALGASLLAFKFLGAATRDRTTPIRAGVVLALGIGAMHYTGMAGMHMPAKLAYDPLIFAASILAAVILSIFAVFVLLKSSTAEEGARQDMIIPGAVAMGLPIAAMHYTAMLGTSFLPGAMAIEPSAELRDQFLAYIDGVIIILIIGVSFAASLIEKRFALQRHRLEAGRNFLETILDSAGEGVVTIKESGEIVSFSGAASAMFGYQPSEVIGQDVSVLMPTEIREVHGDYLANSQLHEPRILRGKRELKGRRKDGSTFPLMLSISPMLFGKKKMYVGVCADDTVRRLHQDELVRAKELAETSGRELEERVAELEQLRSNLQGEAEQTADMAMEILETREQLNEAVESISDGFALWDSEDKLIMCNERYRQIYRGLGDLVVPGVTFEAFIRAAYEQNFFVLESDDIEDAVRDRVARHRTSVAAHEQQLVDGRWVIATKRKTKSGDIVGIVSDISKRKESETMIQKMALEDALTGLANRTQFLDRLREALNQADRTEKLVGLMLLDLDRFKHVNDVHGHPAGDELLRQVSDRLIDCTRKTDTVARLGGDEFAIIATNAQDVRAISVLADKVVEALATPFQLAGNEIHTGTSIGITVYPLEQGSADQLLQNADLALYRAKESGRGTWQIYDEMMSIEVHAQRALETDLRRAVAERQFHIVYQPQFDIESGAIIGAEALLRWEHPERGNVSPAEFIPAAESTGLIIPLTEWLMDVVCSQNVAWQKAGIPPMCVSVNLSPLHIKHNQLVDSVANVLHDTGLSSQWLELEITESMAMLGGDTTLPVLTELKALGVKLAIDDFGTGYSSLDRLKKYPVDRLKIDQSFVRDIGTDSNDEAICSAAIRLGHSLKLRVIAEGVETEPQLDFLRSERCDEIQGYLFSRPLLPEDLFDFVKNYVKDREREPAIA